MADSKADRIGADDFSEALARVPVFELALVHDRQIGDPGCQHRGEQARTLQTAARRISLEHIAIEIGARELLDSALGVSPQDVGHVAFRRGRHQRRAAVGVVDQLHCFAWRAKACLDLGAHRHPLHLRSKDIDEPRVPLVPAVVPHRFAEKARGDADARPIAHAMILSMPKRKEGHSLGHRFETMSTVVTRWTGSTPAFGVACAVIVAWALLGPVFRFSDTWQLVINTGTTIVTFLMVFLIQRSQNKDSLAIHIKLNEIVAALEGASNRLIDAESLSEDELRTLEKYYSELSKLADKEGNVKVSHSVEEARARHVFKHRLK